MLGPQRLTGSEEIPGRHVFDGFVGMVKLSDKSDNNHVHTPEVSRSPTKMVRRLLSL